MDLTIDCTEVIGIEYIASGIRRIRVELRDVDGSDLDNEEVYAVLDVDDFCKHHSLELKGE